MNLRKSTIAVTVVIITVFWGLSPAQASTGDLWFVRTISQGVPGAVELGAVDNPLRWAQDTAASPDGTSVYVASEGDGGSGSDVGALSHFHRATDGALTFRGCLGRQRGCTGDVSLYGLRSIAVLDTTLYGATRYAVVGYSRSSSGALTHQPCLYRTAQGLCTAAPATLLSPVAVTSAPGGRDVYVASTGSGKGVLNHFRRNSADGTLLFSGCIGEGTAGCTSLGAAGVMPSASEVLVSPDGVSVYVVSGNPGSITHFRRDTTTGSLTYAGCIARKGNGLPTGCRDPLSGGLAGAVRGTVTPAGDGVYVVGGGATTHLRRMSNGDLAFAGCIGTADGCRPAGPAGAFTDVTASTDGTSVYAGVQGPSWSWGAVVHFRRAGNGDLTYGGCIGEANPAWCADIGLRAVMNPVTTVLVSADSRSVYATSGYFNGAVTQLGRALT